MISSKLINCSDFFTLENEWKSLEHGKDMTAFQSFEWYKLLVNQYINHSNQIPGKVYFAVAYHDSEIKMVAPLIVIKLPSALKKMNIDNGAHIFGKWGYSDYLNFIYDEFSEECFEKIKNLIKEKLKVEAINLHQILPYTEIRKYIDSNYAGSLLFVGSCSRIMPHKEYDEYYKSLSKSVRQNLRTAQNRADKDGVDIHYELQKNISPEDAEEFYQIYCKRQANKNSGLPMGLLTLANKFMDFLKKIRNSRYNIVTELMKSSENAFILGCFSDDRKIGLCLGLEDDFGIRIPIVCFDEEFSRYSPCMLCIFNYIKDSYLDPNQKIFDLLKGCEQYKLNLGGEIFNIGYYRIEL